MEPRKKTPKEDIDWMDTTDEDEEDEPFAKESMLNKINSDKVKKNSVATVEQWNGTTKTTTTNPGCKKARRRKKATNNSGSEDETSYLSDAPNQNYVRKRQKVNLSISDLQAGDSASDEEWRDKEIKKENYNRVSKKKTVIDPPVEEHRTRVMPRRRASALNMKEYNENHSSPIDEA